MKPNNYNKKKTKKKVLPTDNKKHSELKEMENALRRGFPQAVFY